MVTFSFEEFVTAIIVIISFIILAYVVVGLQTGSSFWYAACSGNMGGELIPGKGYNNSRCNIIPDKEKCELTAFPSIKTAGNKTLPVCVWRDGKCYLNSELTCEDFSQTTTPRCQDVPDCKAVSAIRVAIERLKPGE